MSWVFTIRPKDEAKVETQFTTQIVLVGLKQDLVEDANEVKSNPTIEIKLMV